MYRLVPAFTLTQKLKLTSKEDTNYKNFHVTIQSVNIHVSYGAKFTVISYIINVKTHEVSKFTNRTQKVRNGNLPHNSNKTIQNQRIVAKNKTV